jgi:hypothetical protein
MIPVAARSPDIVMLGGLTRYASMTLVSIQKSAAPRSWSAP